MKKVADLLAMPRRRTLLAFLIAPLWVPLLMTAFILMIGDFSRPADRSFFLFLLVSSAAVSYGGALLLGIPAFWALILCGRTAFWHALVVWLIAGWITLLAFFTTLFPIMLIGWSGFSLSGSIDELFSAWSFSSRETIGLLTGSGLIGVLVGSTAWLIARPDRVAVLQIKIL